MGLTPWPVSMATLKAFSSSFFFLPTQASWISDSCLRKMTVPAAVLPSFLRYGHGQAQLYPPSWGKGGLHPSDLVVPPALCMLLTSLSPLIDESGEGPSLAQSDPFP